MRCTCSTPSAPIAARCSYFEVPTLLVTVQAARWWCAVAGCSATPWPASPRRMAWAPRDVRSPLSTWCFWPRRAITPAAAACTLPFPSVERTRFALIHYLFIGSHPSEPRARRLVAIRGLFLQVTAGLHGALAPAHGHPCRRVDVCSARVTVSSMTRPRHSVAGIAAFCLIWLSIASV